jgi:hypothetical protein
MPSLPDFLDKIVKSLEETLGISSVKSSDSFTVGAGETPPEIMVISYLVLRYEYGKESLTPLIADKEDMAVLAEALTAVSKMNTPPKVMLKSRKALVEVINRRKSKGVKSGDLLQRLLTCTATLEYKNSLLAASILSKFILTQLKER